PKDTIRRVSEFLDSVAVRNGSSYGATGPNEALLSTSAAGLLCRQFLGWGPNDPRLKTGIERFLNNNPSAAVKDLIYYHFATQVLFHLGGRDWQTWNPRVRDLLIDTQNQGLGARQVDNNGSWPPDVDTRGGKGGRVLVTSLSLLTLEVYYRHLPLYPRD